MKNPIGRWLNRSKTAGYAGHSVDNILNAIGRDLPTQAKNNYMDELLKYKTFIDECYQSYDGNNKEDLLMAGAIRGSTGILFAAQYVPKDDEVGRYSIVLAKTYISTISELKDDEEGNVVSDFVRQFLGLAEQALLIVETLDY